MTKFEWVLMAVVVLIVVVAGEIMLTDAKHHIKYDCRLVDISPDMPEQVKQMCRQMRK